MGISGANFLIADAGMVTITTNEGNGRLSTSVPRIHVALTGIEKVIPRLQDLATLWPTLATTGTGQPITCYNTLMGGARRAGEVDGPEEFHVVLVDNGRSELLADSGAARNPPLHPLRRLHQRLPGIPQHRRTCLRRDVSRPYRQRARAAPARLEGVPASLLRVVAVRRLHRRLPRPHRTPPSLAA